MLVPLHGIASRHDLPLPFSFVVIGAALALAISFVVLLVAWRQPRFADGRRSAAPAADPGDRPPGVRLVARLLMLAALRLGRPGPDGRAGSADQPDLRLRLRLDVGRPGADLAAARPVLAGDQPAADRASRPVCAGPGRSGPGSGPAASPVGVWPAAVGLFGFGWLELVQPDRTTLAVLRVWALAWLVIMVLGAIVFGQRWIGVGRSVRDLREHGRPALALAIGSGDSCGWSTRWPT